MRAATVAEIMSRAPGMTAERAALVAERLAVWDARAAARRRDQANRDAATLLAAAAVVVCGLGLFL